MPSLRDIIPIEFYANLDYDKGFLMSLNLIISTCIALTAGGIEDETGRHSTETTFQYGMIDLSDRCGEASLWEIVKYQRLGEEQIRRRIGSMRSCGYEDRVGPSTSNKRSVFTSHASASYPDYTFSVSAPEPFTGGASTSYNIPQYLSSGVTVADPFTSAPSVSECGNVQEDCYILQPLQPNDQYPFTPLAPHG